MADKKISQLPEATTLGSNDFIPVVQGGVNKRVKKSLLSGAAGLKYNNTAGDIATDILQNVDINTGELVTYKEVTTWHDGTAMTDVKVDGKIYRKVETKYYALTPYLAGHTISVRLLGLMGTGTADSSAILQNALNLNAKLYFPRGTYYFNVLLPFRTIIIGDGSLNTIITPYSTSKAAFTSTSIAGSWSYHSVISNLKIEGSSAGIGVAMGKDNWSAYAANDEYCNNITFNNVVFSGLNKGFLAPFGNIGCQFYNCNFNGNKYGVYCIDNKFGAAMHTGNKYFYGGEFNMNDCAVYIHNATDGFGAFSFENTIFQANKLAVYCYTNNIITPLKFTNCWNEVNGINFPYWSGATKEVVLDLWSGSSVINQTLPAKSYIFDGEKYNVSFDDCIIGDIRIKGAHINVYALRGRAEDSTGFGGGEVIVDNKTTSGLYMSKIMTDGGVPASSGCIVEDYFITKSEIRTIEDVYAKSALVYPRFAKVPNYGVGGGETFTTAKTLNGYTSILGTIVNDGLIFTECNEFSVEFDSETRILGQIGDVNIVAGKYYVATVDVKVVSGTSLILYIWDRSSTKLLHGATITETNKWVSIAAIAKCSSDALIYLDFLSVVAQNITWRASALQIRQFSTIVEARSFLKSQTYVMPV